MLLSRFKKAVKKLTRPEEPERIVTDGFTDEGFLPMITHFAQASRNDDGTYRVTFSEKYSVSYHHKSGPRGLSLLQTLEALDKWQRTEEAKPGRAPTDGDLGFEAQHFKDVAQDFGVTLGVEGASLRHAAGIKRMTRLVHKNKPRK